MTIAEMHSELERKLRNLDVVLDIPTSEISKTFYEALYKFIDKYYESFEEDERSRKALSLLTVTDTISVSADSPILPNSYKAVIPSGVLYVVLELVTISGEVVKVKPTTLDSYRINLDNPFKKPYGKLVWRIEMVDADAPTSRLHILVTESGDAISNYQVAYIKEPTYYSIESNPTSEMEVPEIFQYEIIDMALQMLLQSHSILNSKQNV